VTDIPTSHREQSSLTKSFCINNFCHCHSDVHVLRNKNVKKPSCGGLDRLKETKNEQLKKLAHQVPSVLLASHADSTNKVYNRLFQCWKSWAKNYGEISILPADSYFVSLFLIEQSKDKKSAGTLRLFLPALKWAHRMAGLKHDLDQQYRSDIALGLRRVLAKPIQRKEVLTAQDVLRLVEISDLNKITDLRNTCIIVLAFAAFLRFSDFSRLTFDDLKFLDEHLEIKIKFSKTDQLREGKTVCLSKTGSIACPHALLSRYVKHFSKWIGTDSFLFRNLDVKGNFRKENKAMSYTNVKDIVLKKFDQIGLHIKKFGLHSMRAGGATEAANRGTADRLFQRHGRWASVSSKNLYIKDSLSSKLSVSRNLGI
jgi:integrase